MTKILRRAGWMACACWLSLLSACGGGGSSGQAIPEPEAAVPPPPTPAPPPPPDPVPPVPLPPTRHTFRGEVFSFETGAIPDADINLFFWTGNFGCSYWYCYDPLHTDSLGQFEARLPDSTFNVLAFQDGFVQPCAYRAEMNGEDIDARIEMITVASLNAFNPPRPQLGFEPSVTGTIFENTPNGRVALAGAALWAEEYMDVGLARTVSDLGGSFYMCNLPASTWLFVGKNGFKSRWIGPINATKPVVLEIDLERETP